MQALGRAGHCKLDVTRPCCTVRDFTDTRERKLRDKEARRDLLHFSYEFGKPNLGRVRLMEADVPGHANGRTDGVNPALFTVLRRSY
jgi:hypothetical protein